MQKLLTIYLLLFTTLLSAQDSSRSVSKWSINGYLSDLESIQIDQLANSNQSGHMLHNRMNLKWRPTNNINFAGELRNRYFMGESGSAHNRPVFISELERLYIDYKTEKWNLRIGRQRINWSMATIWNPNDIFNAYNFLDIDNEERPGTDACKFQYHINDFSHIDLVHSGINTNQITAANYFFNKMGYDIQLIAANYNGDPTVGIGWAGSIKEAGFKSEVQYYYNHEDSLQQVNLSLGIDYMFNKGWYVNTGFLYNSNGLGEKLKDGQYINLQLSSKNLMPTKYNYLLLLQKQISPLSSVSLLSIYAPKVDLLILMPTFKYNISANLDADFIWQSFFLSRQNQFKGLSQLGFIRIRWSF